MENAPAAAKESQKSLSDKQSAFIRHYVAGANQTDAARLAGYAYPSVDGYRQMQTPHIQAAIQAEIVRKVQTEGTKIAAAFLMDTIQNEKAPWTARVESAKVILNKGALADKVLANQSNGADKPLSEKTTAELEAFINAGLKALDDQRKAGAIDGQAVRVNAQDAEIATSN